MRRPGVPIVAGAAAGGLLAAHALGYTLLLPQGAHRHSVMAATGHGYLPLAAVAGAIAAAVAAASLVARSWAGRRAQARFVPLLLVLGGAQALAFVAMEVGERLAYGAPIDTALDGGLLPLGSLLQFATAAIGAAVLTLAAHAGARAARSLDGVRAATPAPAARVLALPLRASTPPVRRPARTLRSRAPPHPSLAA